MSKLNYFAEKISKFKNRRTKNSNPPPTNELAHPSFGITEDKSGEKKVPNSLLFLMYSKENETLFI